MRYSRIGLAWILAAVLALASTAGAQSLEALQQRFKERAASLREMKTAGRVGETAAGYVEAVRAEYASEDRVAELVRAENGDRELLYRKLAEETGTTPQVVAERNARRNFERAQRGDWLKTSGDRWYQKP